MKINPGKVKSKLIYIPSGKEGTEETLRIMKDQVYEGKRNIDLRLIAAENVSKLKNKSKPIAQIKSIQELVKRKIKYIRDINGIETVQSAYNTWVFGYGDCDDQSVLVATLLECIGFKTGFVAFSFDGINYVHVCAIVWSGDDWVTVETTEDVDVGWFPSDVKNMLFISNE